MPSQEQLDRALRGATRLHVREVIGGSVLLDVRGADDVAAFAATLRIRPGEPFHCLCPGDQTLEFLGPGRRSAVVTLHHGRSLRWDGVWGTDVLLDDPAAVQDWLAKRGVSGPRDEYRRMEEQARRGQDLWEAWKRAAPPCLAPLLDEVSALAGTPRGVEEPAHDRAAGEIRRAYPTERDAILALLEWFGSGEGRWSGFPSYEAVPEWLLLGYPTDTIVAALEGDRPTDAQLEGAARLFASWYFRRDRPGEAARIPETLLARLLEHIDRSPHANNRERLRHALAP